MVSVVCYVCGTYDVCSNIVIGLSVLDMWSVLFVMYVGRMSLYSDWTERTGHVVSVVCYVCGTYVVI